MRSQYLYTFLAFALLSLCAQSIGACVPKDGPPLVDWPSAVECVDGAADDVVPAVTRVLISAGKGETTLSDASLAELQSLGEEHGYDVVTCAVDEVRNWWSSRGATQSPERAATVARAADFFEREDITVTRKGAGPTSSLAPKRNHPVGEPETYLLGLDCIQLTWPERRTARYGFVPIERDPFAETPWHVVQGARGQRS